MDNMWILYAYLGSFLLWEMAPRQSKTKLKLFNFGGAQHAVTEKTQIIFEETETYIVSNTKSYEQFGSRAWTVRGSD